jgi:hypothetical protein
MTKSNEERKPFSRSEHAKYDQPAVNALKALLEGTHYSVKQHPHWDELDDRGKPLEDRGIDLALYKDDQLVGYVDVEVKADWTSPRYPFKTVHFLERKAKYATGGAYAERHCKGLPSWWVLFSADYSQHLSARIDVLREARLVRMATRSGTKNEPFHDVSMDVLSVNKLKRLKRK